MPYRILSLDGGGMRGLLSVLLLERLEEEVPELFGSVDLIAGTSTGGLIALGLAHGVPLSDLRRLYEEEGPAIFADSMLDDLADLDRLVGADYDNEGLAKVLRGLFGEATLADLGKRVLIPTFDLDNGGGPGNRAGPPARRWKAKMMHNFPGTDSDGAIPVWRAGLRTSAAPIYFPSFDGCIDGGVVASNPAVCAIAQTQDRRAFEDPPAMGDIRLLSVGTGATAQYLPGRRHDWGALQWGRPLVDIVMSGSVEVANYQCRSLLGDRFLRVSPYLDQRDRLPLDEHAPWARSRMAEIALATPLEDAFSWLGRFW